MPAKNKMTLGDKMAVLDFLEWIAALNGGVSITAEISDREMQEYHADSGLSDLFDRYVRSRERANKT